MQDYTQTSPFISVVFFQALRYNERMDLETITKKISEKLVNAPDIKARVKFDFGDDGLIFIDSNESPIQISNEDKGDCDVALLCKIKTFIGLMDGTQDPNIAFMMGKLKVKGNMGLAMKLNAMLED